MPSINFYEQDLTFELLQSAYDNDRNNPFSSNNTELNTESDAQKVLDTVFSWHIRYLKSLIDQALDSAVVNKSPAKDQLIRDIAQVTKNLYTALCAYKTDNSQVVSTFSNDARTLISKYRLQTVSNFDSTPLVKNLLLLFSVIGTPFAIYSIGSRIFTGSYAFFDGKGIETHQLNVPILNAADRYTEQKQIDLQNPVKRSEFQQEINNNLGIKSKPVAPLPEFQACARKPMATVPNSTPYSHGAPGIFTASIHNGSGVINEKPISEPVSDFSSRSTNQKQIDLQNPVKRSEFQEEINKNLGIKSKPADLLPGSNACPPRRLSTRKPYSHAASEIFKESISEPVSDFSSYVGKGIDTRQLWEPVSVLPGFKACDREVKRKPKATVQNYTPFSHGAPGVFTASIHNGKAVINGKPVNINEPVHSIVCHNGEVYINGARSSLS